MKSFNKNINKFFQNKIVLYILLGISVLNLLGYLAKNNLLAIIMFIVIGYSCTFFTKNMSYILLIPLLLTNFFVSIIKSNQISFKEGMDGNKKQNKKKTNEGFKKKTNEGFKENINTPKPNRESLNMKNTDLVNSKPKSLNDDDDDDDNNILENYKNPKMKKQETMENAYSSLSKIIGGDKIKKMSQDTQSLVGNQKELFEAINKMEPLMNSANKMLEKFENSPLAKFLPKS
jgi:hypothetical protein